MELDHWRERSYLKRLLDLGDPPKQLFIRGELQPSIFDHCVAVVGSRRLTTYGRQVIDRLVPELVARGKTIISGFMYGTDQYAHQVTVQAGGRTIAVLGWGIEVPLTATDAKLAEMIVTHGGLVLSEWLEQKSTLWTFPVRNRIVAALSEEVYVTEAALKSGSLLTANHAVKLGRPLWAVPGPITSKTSAGTNALIASGQANLYAGEIQTQLPLGLSNNPLIQLLETEPLSADELARKLRQSIAAVGAELSLLTVTGQIEERNGTYFVLH